MTDTSNSSVMAPQPSAPTAKNELMSVWSFSRNRCTPDEAPTPTSIQAQTVKHRGIPLKISVSRPAWFKAVNRAIRKQFAKHRNRLTSVSAYVENHWAPSVFEERLDVVAGIFALLECAQAADPYPALSARRLTACRAFMALLLHYGAALPCASHTSRSEFRRSGLQMIVHGSLPGKGAKSRTSRLLISSLEGVVEVETAGPAPSLAGDSDREPARLRLTVRVLTVDHANALCA